MANRGNQGAEQLVMALQHIASGQVPKDRVIDFGEICSDHSLVMDSYPVPIPRGEWSLLRHLQMSTEETGWDDEHESLRRLHRVHAGDRVVVVWVGNEAVVIGVLTRI